MKRIFCAILVITIFMLTGGRQMADAKTDDLSAQQAAIIPIAAFTANGNSDQLKKALSGGLQAGLTINEIKEVLIQMYAYCGFPRALTALSTFMNLLDERKAQGIEDKQGDAPKKLAAGADRLAIGGKIQTGLVGRPVTGKLYEFCPDIGVFLKEHLFCDIFARNLLTDKEREIATIAALAALPAPEQLESHYKVCLNIGITAAQLRDFVNILAERVGKNQAALAADILAKALKSTK